MNLNRIEKQNRDTQHVVYYNSSRIAVKQEGLFDKAFPMTIHNEFFLNKSSVNETNKFCIIIYNNQAYYNRERSNESSESVAGLCTVLHSQLFVFPIQMMYTN